MHLNQQLAVTLKLCAKLAGNCKDFDPEIFSCTTTQYLLGLHVRISGTLCILLVTVYLCAALLNTLCYPYNTPEHRRNTFLALYLAQG